MNEVVLLVVTLLTVVNGQIDLNKSSTMTHVASSMSDCKTKEVQIRAQLVKDGQKNFIIGCRYPRPGERV